MNFFKWFVQLFKRRKGLGLVRSIPDKRDYKHKLSGSTINNIDLSSKTGRVLNQGRSNACTSFAVCEMLDFMLQYKKKRNWDGFVSSKLFLWYMSRLEEGSEKYNSGVILRNTFKILQTYGFTREQDYPFNNDWYSAPGTNVVVSASIWRPYIGTLPKYYSLNTSNNNFNKHVSNCLSNKSLIVFGFPIRSELSTANSTDYEINTSTGTLKGYHAMLITGETDTHYIIKNSWGSKWGLKGYCHIKKELMKEHGFDFWTLK